MSAFISNSNNQRATVLVFAGLDPTGGAGIQADIETMACLDVHCLPIITCLTVQDTQNAKQIQSVDACLLQQQLDTLLKDVPIHAIKLGLLSNIEIINLVSALIIANPTIPVVFDPILKAGGGAILNDATDDVNDIINAMVEKIIPYTTVITPNSLEARLLTHKESLDDCASVLLKLGCENILITGEHENNPKQITNTLYSSNTQDAFIWPRLPHQYHGTGCTLASAVSAFIVKGFSIKEAAQQAQAFTDATLQQAVKLGQHQHQPNRISKRLLEKNNSCTD